MTIKAGDKVRCIKAWEGYSTEGKNVAQRVGDVFVVTRVCPSEVIHLSGQGYFLLNRFEKVEEAPTQEDTTWLKAPLDEAPKPADWRMQYDNSSARRKDQPVHAGVMEYMPAALRLCAEVSRLGNEKHNPGQELHHARGKSTDNLDAAARHLMSAFEPDAESNLLELVHAFWRIGIQIQVTCEEKYGWPKAPRAK